MANYIRGMTTTLSDADFTVGEMIEILKKYPGDMKVSVGHDHTDSDGQITFQQIQREGHEPYLNITLWIPC